MKYPDISADDFYERINNIYKNFKIKKSKKTMEQLCNPKEFRLQLPQQFLSEFINPKTPYKGILVFHRIGSGKTCTAIQIAEKWKKYKRIIVVLPASLINNFRGELRSLCGGNDYLKDAERKLLATLHPLDERYKEIIYISNDRIDQYYEIFSYNKFVEGLKEKTLNFKNSVLIVDEIQNMVSELGTYYETLYSAIKNAPPDLRIVLLSATPMFDRPSEIALTMNLLRLPNELPTGREFDKTFIKCNKNGTCSVKNIDLFKQRVRGYISFYLGAPAHTFPNMTIKYIKCEMSEFQYSAYLRVLKNEEKDMSYRKHKLDSLSIADLPNNFMLGSREVSSIVFPNRKINEEGFASFTNKRILDNLQKYSCKFYEMMKRIEKSRGKIFVYSNFKEYKGIKSFVRVLEANGYKNYIEHGEGKKRFAIWSGNESIAVKDEIKTVFNMKSNLRGSKLKIMIGSPSIKEGVSLLAVRQVHITDMYWNMARIEQVIGRSSRFCSHKDLEEDQRTVKVYIYIAIAYKSDIPETVDQKILKMALQKDNLIKTFEKAIREVAVDCQLNKNANLVGDDDEIVCDK